MQDEIGVVTANWAKRDAIIAANPRLSARAAASILGRRMAFADAPAWTAEREQVHPSIQPRQAVVRRPPVLRPVRLHPVTYRKRRKPPTESLPTWHVTDIIEAVCKVAGVTPSAMTGYSRSRHNAWPRHVAIYLTEQSRPDWSLPMIARAFNSRHHTTILHAVCNVPLRMMDTRSDSARWYREAVKILSAGEGA